MIKKKLILAAGLLATVLGANCANPKSGALLWEISGKGLKSPSYLLGTLHLKPGEYLDSIPGAREAFTKSKQVIGEVTMADAEAMAPQLQAASMMSPDTTYKMLYSPADYDYVNNFFTKTLGAGLDQLGMLKPAALDLTVMVISMAQQLPGFNPNNVLDSYIQAEAVKQGKAVASLESVDHQIYVLLGSKSLQRQAQTLLCSLQNLDDVMAEFPEMVAAYETGDLDKLYSEFADKNEPCPSTPYEKDLLYKDRNHDWMTKLPALMKANPSFIAVGALHLAGPEGLLVLLDKAGYKVHPVH